MQPAALGSVATRLVATASSCGAVNLWCSATGLLLQRLACHTDCATTLCWSPDGRMLASGALDGSARLWVRTETSLTSAALLKLRAVLAGRAGRVTALSWSPDSTLLVSGSSDGTLRLWRAADGSCLLELNGHGALVTSAVFSPCGTLLASASGDTHCRVWSTDTGECMHDIDWASGAVTHCTFVALGGGSSGSGAHSSGSSANGSGSEARLPRHYLVTCHVQSQRREGRLLLWDLDRKEAGWVDGKLVGPCAAIDGLHGQVTSLDCRAVRASGELGTGLLLATACSDGLLRVWEIANGAAAAPPRTAPPSAAAVPGSRQAPFRPGMQPPRLDPVLLFETPHVRSSSHVDGPNCLPAWCVAATHGAQHARGRVALSPDGQLLAASGIDHCIHLLDVDTGEEQRMLRGHTGVVRSLVWLGERQLLSAGEDGTARVWQLPPDQEL